MTTPTLLDYYRRGTLDLMARIDENPEDRDQEPLRLDQMEECPSCEVLQDVVFQAPAGVFELEDLTEAPEALVTCVSCQYVWKALYSGWTIHEEA